MKIAGIGFRDGATLASIRDALDRAGATDVTRLALPARKGGHPLADDLAAAGYDLTWVTDAALSAQDTPTQSAIARKYYKTGCVPEAAALAAAHAFARHGGEPRHITLALLTGAAPPHAPDDPHACIPAEHSVTPSLPHARILTPRVISTDTLATAALAITGDPA